jgi:TRAP transporter 4TM/12TM fusion protein
LNTDTTPESAPQQNRASKGVTAFLAVVLTLGAIAWAADLFRKVGLLLYTEQFLCGILAVALPLVFVSIRVTRSREGGPIPRYDIAAALLGFLASTYMAVRYPVLAELVSAAPLDGLISGTIMVVLVIEGLRRAVGHVLMAVAVFFILLGLIGHLLPGTLAGREIEWRMLFYYLAWDPTSILGVPMKIVTTIVTAFVLFGQILTKSGGSAFFTELSMVLVGRFRGGQAKIAVTASGFFGSISGSVVSNVVTTGVITIPLMRNAGYRAVQAGAIEAVASTGGQLMPPIMGAAAFLMAEFLEIPYTEVVLAALIPAILYYMALFILADLEAARTSIPRLAKEDIPAFREVVKTGWYFPAPFIVLIAALFKFNYSPEESALLAALVIIVTRVVFSYKGKRLRLRDIQDAIRQTGHAVLDIIMIGAAAGIVIGILNVTGIGFGLSLALVELGSGNIALLLLISAAICILLGMGMPTVGVYLLLATLVAPSLVEVGIDPIAAHLFILYFGMMSMITPPVAIAAFAAASLTGADAMRTGFWAMRFGWFAYLVPFIFIVSPELIMQGSPFGIVYAAVMALIGIWFMSIAMMGFFTRPLNTVFRLLLAAAGLATLIPPKAFGGSLLAGLAGTAVGALIISREWRIVRGGGKD